MKLIVTDDNGIALGSVELTSELPAVETPAETPVVVAAAAEVPATDPVEPTDLPPVAPNADEVAPTA